MGGNNPYIEQAQYELPKTKYRLRFLPDGQEVLVDPTEIPYDDDGLPGSVLDIALSHGIDIDHACGGVLACSTCHVYVVEGLSSCNATSEDEEDMLDNARAVKPGKSRLACQCVPDGTQDVVIEIPTWNRNLARE